MPPSVARTAFFAKALNPLLADHHMQSCLGMAFDHAQAYSVGRQLISLAVCSESFVSSHNWYDEMSPSLPRIMRQEFSVLPHSSRSDPWL